MSRVFVSLSMLVVLVTAAAAEDRAGIEFFETKIRPVLVQECYECHAADAKKLRGGLRLDTRAGWQTGGDSGPAIVPGKPAESPLIEALRHETVAMPPSKKLPDAVIADFVKWIELGAPDPREGQVAPKRAGIDLAAGRQFWAYQPPKSVEPPTVSNADWSRGGIDRFVLARLEQEGLKPVGDAHRATLIRRLYFDLWGLPPSAEEIEAFVNERSDNAVEQLVDRLLESPHFGERWGRHWLDVARFAESLTLRGFIFKPAWRYRDYVIDALNTDRPIDQFLREQVAGDLLEADSLDERRKQMVAVSFLQLGNTNLEEQDKQQLRMDVVDEQLDTLGKAMLAQTIGCARCHDHKFDPIPTLDYYALAGIFRNTRAMEHANVSKWLEAPLPVEPHVDDMLRQYEATAALLETQIKAEKARATPKGKAAVETKGVLAVESLPGIVVDDAQAKKVGMWKDSQHSGSYIGAGYCHDLNEGKATKTLSFQPERLETGRYEVWLAYSAGDSRAANVPVTVFSADGETPVAVNMKAAPPIEGRFLSLGTHQFELGGLGYVLISNEGTQGHVTADAVLFLPADRPIPKVVAATSGSSSKDDKEVLRALETELKRLKETMPQREMTLAVSEEKEITDTQIHVRGSVHNLGDKAPRGFLQVTYSGDSPSLPAAQSGRRELAEWLTSRSNPLTARVFVNRAWHWLFGAGLVRTTDNFGVTGELPSHPELLDHLAVEFQADGWSLKRLVRRIVLSRTYQLAGTSDPQSLAADPENRWLWRSNRRRLDAECLRDAMLAVSGELNRERGGPSYPEELASDYNFQTQATRRSVYLPVFRNSLPEIFTVFDFADPSVTVGRRDVSTVAPQALFLMNHPFVSEQARHSAKMLLVDVKADDELRTRRAYLTTLGREPTDSERRAVRDCLKTEPNAERAWSIVFHALFASIDFRYVD